MKPQVTLCLTNWMRPELLRQTIDSILAQSIPSTLFLWNNGAEIRHSALSWVVNSSVNQMCWPRWFMASYACTEYVCVVDDDVQLRDSNVLETVLERVAEAPSHCIVGPEGVKLREGKTYRDAEHIRVSRAPSDRDTPCDLIKGEFMALRTSALHGTVLLADPRFYREDDIAVSALLARGRRGQHRCLTTIGHRFRLIDAPHALWRQEGHYERRQQACDHYFGRPALPTDEAIR
jgi:hypothetical protein